MLGKQVFSSENITLSLLSNMDYYYHQIEASWIYVHTVKHLEVVYVTIMMWWSVMMIIVRSKEVTGLVKSMEKQPHHCVIVNYASSLIVGRLEIVSCKAFPKVLRPLKFSDIDKVFTYASPAYKYFQGRYAVCGSVTLLCELHWSWPSTVSDFCIIFKIIHQCLVRLFRIKFLDQFQGCYKYRYRWFAGYYFICHQVIMSIVFFGNTIITICCSNYKQPVLSFLPYTCGSNHIKIHF